MIATSEAHRSIVDRLNSARTEAGSPSSRKLAARIGNVSHTTVAEAFSGRRLPSWPVLAAIFGALEVDPLQYEALWELATHQPSKVDIGLEVEDSVRRYRAALTNQIAAATSDSAHTAGLAETLYVQHRIVAGDAQDQILDPPRFASKTHHAVILGLPGSGKTTLCKTLASQLALQAGDAVPFLVSAAQFANQSSPAMAVADYIEQHVRSHFQIAGTEGFVATVLRHRPTLVMIDGLDEVPYGARMQDCAEVIGLFAREFPLSKIVVTTRPGRLPSAGFAGVRFQLYDLLPFNQADVDQFASHWFDRSLGADETEAALFALASLLAHTKLDPTPLVLSLACQLIARRQVGTTAELAVFCDAYVEAVCLDWKAPARVDPGPHLRTWLRSALARLAYESANRPASLLTEQDLDEAFRDSVATSGVEVSSAENRMLAIGRILRGAILQEESPGDHLCQPRFAFSNEILRDYLVGAHLIASADLDDVVIRFASHIAAGRWQPIGRFCVQIASTAPTPASERFFEQLMRVAEHLSNAEYLAVLRFMKLESEHALLPLHLTEKINSRYSNQLSLISSSEEATNPPNSPGPIVFSALNSFAAHLETWLVEEAVPQEVQMSLATIRALLVQSFDHEHLRVPVALWGWTTLEANVRGRFPEDSRRTPWDSLEPDIARILNSMKYLLVPDVLTIALEHGAVRTDQIDDLKLARRLRNEAAHGSSSPRIDLQILVRTTRVIHEVINNLYRPQQIDAASANRPKGGVERFFSRLIGTWEAEPRAGINVGVHLLDELEPVIAKLELLGITEIACHRWPAAVTAGTSRRVREGFRLIRQTSPSGSKIIVIAARSHPT